jgi:hypothetical protein
MTNIRKTVVIGLVITCGLIMVLTFSVSFLSERLWNDYQDYQINQQKPKGYTIIEYGKAINEKGDTIIIKPIFK